MTARKPQPTLAERRRRLLDHGCALLVRQGYTATSFEQIAAAAGLTPSSAGRAFADLPAILQAVIDEFHERLFDHPPQSHALGQLQALVESFQADAGTTNSPTRVLLTLFAERAADARKTAAQALIPTAESLAELIRSGQHEGVFRRTLDPQQAAWELLRAMFGQALLKGVEPPSPVDPEHLSGFDVLLHGLLKTDI